MLIRRLLEAIVDDLRQYLLLIVFCLISLSLFANRESASLRYIRIGGLEAFGFIESSLTFLGGYFNLYSENQALRERNLSLSAEVNLLRNAFYENDRLNTALAFKERTPVTLKTARVVDRTFSPEKNFITINLGSSDSLQPDMPVITDAGLVGRTVLTSPHYSLIQLAINTDFKIGVVSEISRTVGIVNWKGGSSREAAMDYVPISNKLTVGERLFTTEYSTFASPNILVGRIKSVEEGSGQRFLRVTVEFEVDFPSLSVVFVELRAPTLEKKSVMNSYSVFQSQ